MVFWVLVSTGGYSQYSVSGFTMFSTLSTANKNLAKNGITVLPNGYLVMDEDLDLNANAQIIVQYGNAPGGITAPPYTFGGRLILQKKLTCSAGVWQGIRVYGIPNAPHFMIDPDESITNDIVAYMGLVNEHHGFVDIQEGAIIERAKHGIWSSNGGIVQCFVGPNAIMPQFLNCKIGIYIHNSLQEPSATRINRCEFTWTDPSIQGHSDYRYFSHVNILLSKGIRFGGCYFFGEFGHGNTYDTDVKGNAVVVTNAGKFPFSTFSIGEAGNTFQTGTGSGCVDIKYKSQSLSNYKGLIGHFTTGVDIIGCDEGAINNTFFFANMTAIAHDGGHIDIHDNIFKAEDAFMLNHFNPSSAGSGVEKRFIFMNWGKGDVSIYRNVFNNTNVISPSPWLANAMIDISVAGPDGVTPKNIKIIDNVFNGDVGGTSPTVYAIKAFNRLQNFEWKCNTFNNFETAVIYGGAGPAQNPSSNNRTKNTYNNISMSYVDNQSSQPLTYINLTGIPDPYNGFVNYTARESTDCGIDCNSMFTKYKNSPSNASLEDIETEVMTLYPNPASSEINVKIKDGLGARLEIYSIMGELVYAETLESAHTQIDCSSFTAGLYAVTIISDKGMVSKKIIVNR